MSRSSKTLTDCALALGAVFTAALSACGTPPDRDPAGDDAGTVSPAQASVDLPGGSGGIGLDDLRYSARLGRLVVAAGLTGSVDFVTPDTLSTRAVSGFTTFAQFDGSDQQGAESADEGAGLVFVNDRAAFKLGVVDPASGGVVAQVQLEHTEPDYVRYVAATSEVWITNPGSGRIDVLSVPAGSSPTPVHQAFIDVPGGVEGLTIDNTRRQAYTHLFRGAVAVIDLDRRAVVATYETGCNGSHGIPALDEEQGWLFSGCSDARVVALDLNHGGAQLGGYTLGSGATILAYAKALHHLYMRGDGQPTVAMLDVAPSGALSVLGTVQATALGHCMTADDRGQLWVCDRDHGRLIRFADPYPAD